MFDFLPWIITSIDPGIELHATGTPEADTLAILFTTVKGHTALGGIRNEGVQ
jgi:hypothetical protein